MPQAKLKMILQSVALGALVLSAICGYLVSHMPLLWKIGVALSAACAMGAVWLGRVEIKAGFSRRAVRYGINSVVMSLIVLAIVVVLNLIAVGHDLKVDITKNKLHTLSDQTIKVLKGLTRDVKLRAFISPMQMQDFNDLFDKYGYQSKHIKREFVDVDKDPLSVRKFEIKQAGTIIVESETRSAKVEGISGPDDPRVEEKLTNAIIQVEKGSKKKIYFINGHGERMITDSTKDGYSGMKEVLNASRFDVEALNLVEKDKIPADAEILVIAGPRKDFINHELTQLEEYLRNGGKVLIMMEPDSTKTIQPLLAKYGVAWNQNKAILERNRLQQLADGNPLTPIVTSYDGSHEITRDARQMSIFAIATPVEKASKIPEGVTVATLFSTSKYSQESQVDGNRLAINDKADRKGPLALALAISGAVKKAAEKEEKKEPAAPGEEPPKGPEFRLVVVGDSDFAGNALRGYGVNADLFQNMLSWLAKEEDLISIRPKATDESSFDITEFRMRVINLASMVFLPFAMFLSGIGVWLTRRRK